MGHGSTTIPIASAAPAGADAGCCACSHARQATLCRRLPEPVSGPPVVSGPGAQTTRLLRALGAALGEPVDGPDNRLVRALHCQDGEVSLQLSLSPHCGGGAELAQTAFDTLRRLLPDTDIYVTHRA